MAPRAGSTPRGDLGAELRRGSPDGVRNAAPRERGLPDKGSPLAAVSAGARASE